MKRMESSGEDRTHSFCLPQKVSCYAPQVGLLARRGTRKLVQPFRLPRVVTPSGFDRNGNPHLQWRDRAGISPDFPVTPLWAPEV